MPGRKIPLVTGQLYHVFNRGVARLPTFTNESEYNRAMALINYYRFANVSLKYSNFNDLPLSQQQEILDNLKKQNDLLVKIHSFILMPNHFHFALEPVIEGGISRFISNFSNSYTKYVNTVQDRVGPLFQGKFKAVHIKSDSQLTHLSRYHHLNIYTDGVVTTIDQILNYSYSSMPNYLGGGLYDFVETELVLSHFKSREAYKIFVLNNKDYQRNLGKIRKLLHEKTVRNHLGGV